MGQIIDFFEKSKTSRALLWEALLNKLKESRRAFESSFPSQEMKLNKARREHENKNSRFFFLYYLGPPCWRNMLLGWE